MGLFARGSIVLVEYPFTDLSRTGKRPALVIADSDYNDVLLCQITSKTYRDRDAIKIEADDFEQGQLPLVSYARPSRLSTIDSALVIKEYGRITEAKRAEIITAIERIIA